VGSPVLIYGSYDVPTIDQVSPSMPPTLFRMRWKPHVQTDLNPACATLTAQPPMELPARIGKYELEEFLGGGMSHVYRARDTVIGRTVAVKILTEQGLRGRGSQGPLPGRSAHGGQPDPR